MSTYCKKCKEEISLTQHDFYGGLCINCYNKKKKKSNKIKKRNEALEENPFIFLMLYAFVSHFIALFAYGVMKLLNILDKDSENEKVNTFKKIVKVIVIIVIIIVILFVVLTLIAYVIIG